MEEEVQEEIRWMKEMMKMNDDFYINDKKLVFFDLI